MRSGLTSTASTLPEVDVDEKQVSLVPDEELANQKTLIKALIANLKFDIAVLHAGEDFETDLNLAKTNFAAIKNNAELAEEAIGLAERLGVYYAYHQRDADIALPYLQYYKDAVAAKVFAGIDPRRVQLVEANMYLQFANSAEHSDINYNNADKIYEAAQATVKKLREELHIAPSGDPLSETLPTSIEYAQACMYLGYIGTVKPANNDEQLFVISLANLNNYLKQNVLALTPQEHAKIVLLQGYNETFIGLQIHRKSYQVVQPGDEAGRIAYLNTALIHHMDKGVVYYAQASETLQSDPTILPRIVIEQSNTFHIMGVIRGKMGNRAGEMQAYDQAITKQNTYNKLTSSEHWMTFITAINYSLALAQFGKGKEDKEQAILFLLEMLERQKAYFNNVDAHFDIAKTLHFIGKLYDIDGFPILAREYFQAAYDMKMQLKAQPLAGDVLDTQGSLLKAAVDISEDEFQPLQFPHLIKAACSVAVVLDWNRFQTIKPFEGFVKSRLLELTNYLLVTNAIIDPDPMKDMLPLLHNVGAYYCHVKRSGADALEYLLLGLNFCDNNSSDVDPELHHWFIDLVAFAFHQEYGLCVTKSLGADQSAALEFMRTRYEKFNGVASAALLGADDILKYFYTESIEAAERAKAFTLPNNPLVQNRIVQFGRLIAAYSEYERQRAISDPAKKREIMESVVRECLIALKGYEDHNDFQEQYLRVKNRAVDQKSELLHLLDPAVEADAALIEELQLRNLDAMYDEIEAKRLELGTAEGNRWAAITYNSHANYLADKEFNSNTDSINYLSDANGSVLEKAIDRYEQAHVILVVCDGKSGGFPREIEAKVVAKQATYDAWLELKDARLLAQAEAFKTESRPSQTGGVFAGSADDARRLMAEVAELNAAVVREDQAADARAANRPQ